MLYHCRFWWVCGFFVVVWFGVFFPCVDADYNFAHRFATSERQLAALAAFPDTLGAATECVHVSPTAAPCVQ